MHQRERTLVEVGRQSELRVLRGDAALVADDGDRAFAMYRDAARMFDPFEPELGADLLAMLAGKVYETSRRSLIDKFGVARRLLDELAAHPFVAADPVEGAIADYRRSLIYNREGVQDAGQVDEPVDGPHEVASRDVPLEAELVEQRLLDHRPFAHHQRALHPKDD